MQLSGFGGLCYHCKQTGHKAHECPKKTGNRNGKTNGKSNGKGRCQGKCNKCGRQGHKVDDCWEKEENKEKRPKWYKGKAASEVGAAATDASKSVEFALTAHKKFSFPETAELLKDENVWIADTGATVHTMAHKGGMHSLKKVTGDDSITMGNGIAEKAALIGELTGTICDKNGDGMTTATMSDVVYLPTGKFNLFSLTKMTRNQGWILGGDDKGIWLTKGDQKLLLYIAIPFAMYIKRDIGKEMAQAMVNEKSIPIQLAHDRLGHPHEDMTRKMAKELGWTLSRGNLKPCNGCTAGKAKQKNVPKESGHVVATEPNKARVFLDIAMIKKPEAESGSVYKLKWRIVVDERTQMKFSDFFVFKSGMAEPTCELFQRWKDVGREVRYLRMDNAGENKLWQSRCDSPDWKFRIQPEYTASYTPQQNHLAELGFTIILNRGRAMMAHANVPLEVRYKIWRHAFKTATLLDGLTVITVGGKTATRFVLWAGKNPKFADHLRTWGEAGSIMTRVRGTPKIADRGTQCMMVGYSTVTILI
jgi:hypothetical protein